MNGSVSKGGTLVVERREDPRIRIELPLDYSLANTNQVDEGIIADVSEGGSWSIYMGKQK